MVHLVSQDNEEDYQLVSCFPNTEEVLFQWSSCRIVFRFVLIIGIMCVSGYDKAHTLFSEVKAGR